VSSCAFRNLRGSPFSYLAILPDIHGRTWWRQPNGLQPSHRHERFREPAIERWP